MSSFYQNAIRSSAPNQIAMIGDSITGALSVPDSSTSTYTLGTGLPLTHAMWSEPRLVANVAAGISGNTSAQMLARIQTDVIAHAPDWCVVMAGSNDAAAAVSVATFAANMTAIADALSAASIRPVFATTPPQSAATVAANTTKRLLASRYNTWLRYYAYSRGYPLVDFLPTLMDPATGGYLSGYDSGDGIHPNAAGYKVIGEAIGSALTDLLAPWSPPFPLHAVAADSANLVPNALFLADANVDGTPDSWTKTGTATASIDSSPSAPVVGHAFKLVDTLNSFTQVDASLGASCWTQGDRIVCCGRFKSATTSGSGNLVLKFTSASPTQNVRPVGTYGIDSGGWRSFYIEYVTPAVTTTGALSLQAQGTGVELQIAQVAVYNLTALGIA